MTQRLIATLSESEIQFLSQLQLYGEREVARDRCLIGYYQKLKEAEFLSVNGCDLIDRNTLFIHTLHGRTIPRSVPLHPFTSQVFKKYNNDIPVLDSKTFRHHFADLYALVLLEREKQNRKSKK